jgi:hypothetical protein
LIQQRVGNRKKAAQRKLTKRSILSAAPTSNEDTATNGLVIGRITNNNKINKMIIHGNVGNLSNSMLQPLNGSDGVGKVTIIIFCIFSVLTMVIQRRKCYPPIKNLNQM